MACLCRHRLLHRLYVDCASFRRPLPQRQRGVCAMLGMSFAVDQRVSCHRGPTFFVHDVLRGVCRFQVIRPFNGTYTGVDVTNALSAPWAPSFSSCSAGTPRFSTLGVQDILRPGARLTHPQESREQQMPTRSQVFDRRQRPDHFAEAFTSFCACFL